MCVYWSHQIEVHTLWGGGLFDLLCISPWLDWLSALGLIFHLVSIFFFFFKSAPGPVGSRVYPWLLIPTIQGGAGWSKLRRQVLKGSFSNLCSVLYMQTCEIESRSLTASDVWLRVHPISLQMRNRYPTLSFISMTQTKRFLAGRISDCRDRMFCTAMLFPYVIAQILRPSVP